MREELISFETAKLAKEKGFDELCCYSFETENNFYETVKLWRNSEDSTEYAVCTQSLLQKWLREEHNIHVEISFIYDDETFCLILFHKKENIWFDPEIGYYHTYEEALEAGLKKALELIK